MSKGKTPENAENPSETPPEGRGEMSVSREDLMIEDLGNQVAAYSKEVSFWKTEARVAQAELAQLRQELDALRDVVDEAMTTESQDEVTNES